MVSKSVKEASEETKMELTPMIDVTFLLLIFFLCSIKFKILEGKLQTFLPKDVGVNATPIDQLLEKVDVAIFREGNYTFEAMGLSEIDNFAKWKNKGWKIDQVIIKVNGTRVPTLKALGELLDELRKATPAPDDPDGPDDILGTEDDESDSLKMNIEAMPGALYEDVIQVVDVAIASDFTSITFRGVPTDA